jgi:hippurate hydrolase
MVEEGCLDQVEEVYGLHNIPNFDEGDIRVCPGPFFAAVTVVTIKVKGQGGHGSTPHKLIDPITCANQMLQAFHTIKSRNLDSRQNVVFTICHFQSGHTFNVFPDEAVMRGTIRSYDKGACDLVHQRIRDICEHTGTAFGCTVDVDLNAMYPAVLNHEKEAGHIERLATKWFGKEHVSQNDLPLSASEDFSYFINEKPGCFFALGTLKPGHTPRTLHTSTYNFNDDMVATGGYFWLRVLEDRLNCKFL